MLSFWPRASVSASGRPQTVCPTFMLCCTGSWWCVGMVWGLGGEGWGAHKWRLMQAAKHDA